MLVIMCVCVCARARAQRCVCVPGWRTQAPLSVGSVIFSANALPIVLLSVQRLVSRMFCRVPMESIRKVPAIAVPGWV